MLQNAGNGISDLRQVKLDADQSLLAHGYTASYENYGGLLLNACACYDADWHTRGQHTPSNRRAVYATDIGPDNFGFDTPVSVVSAFRTRMSGSQWHNLDSESQPIWDSFSDTAKEIILGGWR